MESLFCPASVPVNIFFRFEIDWYLNEVCTEYLNADAEKVNARRKEKKKTCQRPLPLPGISCFAVAKYEKIISNVNLK